MELWLYQPFNGTKTYKWSPIKSCRLNFTIPESGKLPTQLTNNETICEVPIPDAARHRSPNKKAVKPLKARFLISSDEAVVATVPFDLTRVKERQPGTFWSSSSSSKSTEARNLLNDSPLKNKTRKEEPKEPMWIPYLKYGRAPIRVRIVAEYREFGVLVRNDGLEIPVWNHTTYRPLIYVDDLSLQHSAQSELAPPEDNKPPVKLQIKLNSVSPIVDAFIRQMYTAFSTVEAMLQGEEMDEIRYFLSDERLYRFVLTQLISYVHMWLDYLAFRDEVRFYKGKQNFSGISTSTVLTRLICSIIILLYLLDGGGTSWVVLLSLFGSCSVEAWKVCKLLRPTLKPRFPFISIRHLQTVNEQETAEYDRIASTNLAMILYPLVIGWSLYALQHYEYTSWYSWLISNLANAVYT